MKPPTPTHREAVALFRRGVIGDLLATDLEPGELQVELMRRAQRRYRPPGASRTRRYHWKSLQRWFYLAKAADPGALEPASRQRGIALALTEEQRTLLLDTRRAHRGTSAELILAEAVRNGVLTEGQVSVSTVRRLFAQADLARLSTKRIERGDVQRKRWQAASPGDLWHGDVCHLVLPDEQGRRRELLVHGLLDDASRYFVGLQARASEREEDLLEVLCGALLRYPAPRAFLVDNGSCYRGEVLALLCKRLGIRLIHAQPYDPQARGKMERVWRTLRQRCTDHLPGDADLHQANQALWAWLDGDYHRRPHGGLMGATPRRRYLDSLPRQGAVLTAQDLAKALEVPAERQVRRDGTFDVGARVYEVVGHHLLGKRIQLVLDGLTGNLLRASWQGQAVRFGPCDPVANSDRSRARAPKEEPRPGLPFDPIAALLQKAREVDGE